MLLVSPRSHILLIICLVVVPDMHFLSLSRFVVASELFNVEGTPELRQDILVGLSGVLACRVVRVAGLSSDRMASWAAPGAGCSGAVGRWRSAQAPG